MDQDEEATIRTLTTYRSAITDLVQQYRGRVVDMPGDNILAEFSSVVDAVNCAVEIQRELAERNTELSEDRRMHFRIGVNLGDIVEEESRIYGDGVNIAARVESMADAGGICISGRAYDQVANKLGLEYENLGEHQVKNISTPIRVYRVLSYPGAAAHRVVQTKKAVGKTWRNLFVAIAAILIVGVGAAAIWNFYFRLPSVEPVSVEKMAYPLPDKPSIAVLPFVNMSGDTEQEYFSDGITEDLITDLSKISGLFIIARNSTFVYKGKPVKIRQVAEELGVRYVLEGSVRKAQERVRINAQLIDATTGHHIWAERYDGKLEDIFTLQDKVTQKIVKELAVKLTMAEREHVLRKETDNILAYEAYLKGLKHYGRFNPDDLAKAAFHFNKAIELDPNYGRAYAALALAYNRASDVGWVGFLKTGYVEAWIWTRKYLRLAMKEPTSLVHQLASKLNNYQRLYKEAISEAEQAIALDPNDPGSYHAMAEALIWSGRSEEAVEFIKKAMRLDPHKLAPYLYLLGLARFSLGQMQEAAALIERALTLRPEAILWRRTLTAVYVSLGRIKEAQAQVGIFWDAQAGPGTAHLRRFMHSFPFKNLEVAERFADGLLKAGIAGERSGYYKVYAKNRLTGEEIRALVFGRKVSSWEGIINRTKDGKATISIGFIDSESGKSWVEDDKLCNQWQTFRRGIKHCAPVFRNPGGTPDRLDEYLWITDRDFITFSPMD
jgi:TolB-like protein